jgi:hypothetical protein
MVDKYLQHVGLVLSGQRKKLHLSVRMSGCTFPDFRRMSDHEVRYCCLLKRTMLWNRSKRHSSAPKGSLQVPVQILNHRPQTVPFSWTASEESLEKVTVLTSKRLSRSWEFQICTFHFALNKTFSIGSASDYGLLRMMSRYRDICPNIRLSWYWSRYQDIFIWDPISGHTQYRIFPEIGSYLILGNTRYQV